MTTLTKTNPTETVTAEQAAQSQLTRLRPRVDIIDKDDSIVVIADMPGVAADALEITLENNQLTLHGQAERIGVMYQRAFTLSKQVDQTKIDAAVEQGVLTLTLPKMPKVEPISRKIVVNQAKPAKKTTKRKKKA